jgi:hypothetical protein
VEAASSIFAKSPTLHFDNENHLHLSARCALSFSQKCAVVETTLSAFERYYTEFFRFLSRKLRDKHLAEELTRKLSAGR